jgi:hypothetical protein
MSPGQLLIDSVQLLITVIYLLKSPYSDKLAVVDNHGLRHYPDFVVKRANPDAQINHYAQACLLLF